MVHLGDALGSVRQIVDDTGEVTLARDYEPYGEVLSAAGNGTTSYGFTNEYTSQGLIDLRARWYAPSQGRFLNKDSWQGNSYRPLSFNAWLYAEANPVNFTDPSGRWRWRPSGSIYHSPIEDYYEQFSLNPIKQLEYRIPGTPLRHPDMFNSLSGDVYEIEPFILRSHGAKQVLGYVTDLNFAASAGLLQGYFASTPYDWNATLFHVGTGIDWPGRFRQSPVSPIFPYFDLVADYVGNGVIVFWLEPNAALLSLPYGFPRSLLRPKNWNPKPVYQLAEVIQVACGVALVVAGGALIAVTIVEDVSLIGIADDMVTVPGGVMLINTGLRLAIILPTP